LDLLVELDRTAPAGQEHRQASSLRRSPDRLVAKPRAIPRSQGGTRGRGRVRR
jgi:hypothetical protein